MISKFSLLNVNVSAINPEVAFNHISERMRGNEKVYVCVAPVSTIMSCQDDEAYRKVVNNADMVTPDGMPVVWLAHLKGHKEVRRTYGPDLMRAVCDKGRDQGCRHYLLGATEETLDKLSEELKEIYPGINIAGKFSPPFHALSDAENDDICRSINDANPDIVWVGLGSPKQDFWMAQNRGNINAPVMVGVGAAFDFLAGVKPQAPKLMQCCGLEWLFRLGCEPGRLWKRYFIGNSRFIYLVFKNLILGKI